jgi:hypothetical protein
MSQTKDNGHHTDCFTHTILLPQKVESKCTAGNKQIPLVPEHFTTNPMIICLTLNERLHFKTRELFFSDPVS